MTEAHKTPCPFSCRQEVGKKDKKNPTFHHRSSSAAVTMPPAVGCDETGKSGTAPMRHGNDQSDGGGEKP